MDGVVLGRKGVRILEHLVSLGGQGRYVALARRPDFELGHGDCCANLTTSPTLVASKTSRPSSTFPNGLSGRSLCASRMNMQTRLPDARNATSPLTNCEIGFSTPTRSSVKRLTIAGWTDTLLSKGRLLSMALTVRGAKCRKSETFAVPFPRTDARQSTLETEPAEAPV